MTRGDFSDEDDEVEGAEKVTIFGNEKVHVQKDVDRKQWIVSAVGRPGDALQHLCTIPWAHAFKEWPHAKDYGIAVKTCQASEVTCLTEDEEAEALAEIELETMGVALTPSLPEQLVEEPLEEAFPEDQAGKVIPFRKR